jgi:hypothetical protein
MDDRSLTDKEQEEFIKEMAQAVADDPWKAVPYSNFIKGLGQNKFQDKAKNEILLLQWKIDTVLAYINKSVDTSRDQCRNGIEETYWDIIDNIKRDLEFKFSYGSL